MLRNMEVIQTILKRVLVIEAESGEPTVFRQDENSDDIGGRAMRHWAEIMEKAGLLHKVEAQADFEGLDCFRITWKGHCFIDLYTIYAKAKESGNSLELLVASLALAAFY